MSGSNSSGGDGGLKVAAAAGAVLSLVGIGLAVKSSSDTKRQAAAEREQLREEMRDREDQLRRELENRTPAQSTPQGSGNSRTPPLDLGGLVSSVLGGLFGGGGIF
ncbi:hypothetical protein NR798_24145 [Archangium gephyra]|uniref:hypothetical protein n=1 Tax=Archangium gephyra TaxID=48 RepID=UPI0035D4331B